MSIAGHLAAIAAAEVGVVEQGQNSGPRVMEYQRATWLKPGPWPWCAAYVSWCVREWLKTPAARQAVLIANGIPAEQWRCRDARAYGWEDWAKKHGITLLTDRDPMLPGDIVTFDFSHIGIVEEDRGDDVHTIEGNTNRQGSREGDGVYRKRRARGLVRSVIRLVQPSADEVEA